jgi:hypothetical protein
MFLAFNALNKSADSYYFDSKNVVQTSEIFLHRTVNHGAKPRVVEPSTELIAMNTLLHPDRLARRRTRSQARTRTLLSSAPQGLELATAPTKNPADAGFFVVRAVINPCAIRR